MEEIEKLLEADEKILWKSNITNMEFIADLRAFKYLYLVAIIFAAAGVILILVMIEWWWVWLIFTLTIPNLFTFGVIFARVSFKRRFMSKLQLSYKEFKNYINVYVLTNKRWIQKSMFVIEMDTTNIPSGHLEIKDDIAITNLDNIKMFEVSTYEIHASLYNYLMYIGFNINPDLKYDVKEDLKHWAPMYLGAVIPFEEFPEFMSILITQIPVQKEKHKYLSDLIYYRKE